MFEAPYGLAINNEVRSAELVYADQEIEITEISASFTNDRQKAEVSLSKVMAQDAKFGIGSGNKLSAVTFGLYAAEDLTAADETMIPADGLIGILSVSENGKASAKPDLPFGSCFMQEISTDCHYILSDEKYENKIFDSVKHKNARIS